jgi:hypothetical protein
MRLILIGIAAAATLLAITPASSAPRGTDSKAEAQDGPHGDRWSERWKNRRHYLFDDADAGAVSTDGYNAQAESECRKVPIREQRTDGTTTVRRVTRCD